MVSKTSRADKFLIYFCQNPDSFISSKELLKLLPKNEITRDGVSCIVTEILWEKYGVVKRYKKDLKTVIPVDYKNLKEFKDIHQRYRKYFKLDTSKKAFPKIVNLAEEHKALKHVLKSRYFDFFGCQYLVENIFKAKSVKLDKLSMKKAVDKHINEYGKDHLYKNPAFIRFFANNSELPFQLKLFAKTWGINDIEHLIWFVAWTSELLGDNMDKDEANTLVNLIGATIITYAPEFEKNAVEEYRENWRKYHKNAKRLKSKRGS